MGKTDLDFGGIIRGADIRLYGDRTSMMVAIHNAEDGWEMIRSAVHRKDAQKSGQVSRENTINGRAL